MIESAENMLGLSHSISRITHYLITSNGPAVGLSKRYPTQAPGTYPGTPRQRGQKTVTVQGGYGALFAVRIQSFLNITRVALQV